MDEQKSAFVVNDRRRHRMDGELREDAPTREPEPKEEAPQPVAAVEPETVSAPAEEASEQAQEEMPPPPTAEEIEQVRAAYEQTADRLETVMRATNPGGEVLLPMNFAGLVQSLYMTSMMQLGFGTPQGEQARVDIIGARQSIEMLRVLEEKSEGNRSQDETELLQSALLELRMAFLRTTQLIAQQAQRRQQGPGVPGDAPGPKLVR